MNSLRFVFSKASLFYSRYLKTHYLQYLSICPSLVCSSAIPMVIQTSTSEIMNLEILLSDHSFLSFQFCHLLNLVSDLTEASSPLNFPASKFVTVFLASLYAIWTPQLVTFNESQCPQFSCTFVLSHVPRSFPAVG